MAETRKLEVKVFDEIHIDDSLDRVIEFVVEKLKKWADSDDTRPFEMTVTKIQGRAPPAIEINVSDTIKAKAVFG